MEEGKQEKIENSNSIELFLEVFVPWVSCDVVTSQDLCHIDWDCAGEEGVETRAGDPASRCSWRNAVVVYQGSCLLRSITLILIL